MLVRIAHSSSAACFCRAIRTLFPCNGLYAVTVDVSDDTGAGTGTPSFYVGLELTITKRNLAHSFVRWPGVFAGFS